MRILLLANIKSYLRRAIYFALVLPLISVAEPFPANKSTSFKSETSNKQDRSEGNQLAWRMSMGGIQNQDPFTQKTLTDVSLSVSFQLEPNEYLDLLLEPELLSEIGYRQDQTNSGSKSELRIANAEAKMKFSDQLSLSAGALDQSYLPKLLISRRAFPALRLSFNSIGSKNIAVIGQLQTAVPTSSNLSAETRDLEKIPSFNSFNLKLLTEHSASLKSGLGFTYFSYLNLPSSTALSSSFLGNNFISDPSGDIKLASDFEGLVASTSVSWNWTKALGIEINLQYIDNLKATDLNDAGQLAELIFPYKISDRLTISPIYRAYSIEPDSTVAGFASSQLQTNRVGYQAGTKIQFNKNLLLYALAGEREVVFVNNSQFRERQVEIRMETANASF